MTKSMSVVFIVMALLAPFWFPYPATIVLSFLAGIVFPPIALFVGFIADLVYFSPPSALPWGLIWGLCATIVAFFVRRFIKARIIMG